MGGMTWVADMGGTTVTLRPARRPLVRARAPTRQLAAGALMARRRASYNPEGETLEAGMALPQGRTPQSDSDRPAGAPGPEPDWRARYEIENPDKVEELLAEHPEVGSILEQAPREIGLAFDEEPRLVFRLEIDPEDEPATGYLVVDIMTQRDADDAFSRLNLFDERWWLNVIPRVGADLVFYPRFA
jgi:hypothetical protein